MEGEPDLTRREQVVLRVRQLGFGDGVASIGEVLSVHADLPLLGAPADAGRKGRERRSRGGVSLVEVARARVPNLAVRGEPGVGRPDDAEGPHVAGRHLDALALELRRDATEVLDEIEELRVVHAPREPSPESI